MESTGIVEGWKDGGKKSFGDRRSRRSPPRRTKPGLPRHSVVTAGGFGAVPLGVTPEAPRSRAESFTQ